jgi:leucyl/phenylalanyl-tRNA--protein transferase
MPIYRLTERILFPPVELAEPSGLLAIGGDLRADRLLRAYAEGIFPWYSEGEPILWFSPDPRAVLLTKDLRVDRGMRRTLVGAGLTLTMDRAFEAVIVACAETPRRDGAGTWITRDMIDAYCRLHELGYAHSIEGWREGEELAGGVYGVNLGATFSAESMFRRTSGGSLVPLIGLIRQLARWGIRLLDCQMTSPLVERLGAREWPRRRFLAELQHAVVEPTRRGRWHLDDDLIDPAR